MDNVKGVKRGEGQIGKHYEKYIFALISIKCLLHPEIKDFWIGSNLSIIEKFDDVVLHVEFKNGTKKVFLIQIKHKQKRDKCVVADMLCTSKKDFSLKMYEDAYFKIMADKDILRLIEVDENTTINFIILNNCKLELNQKNDKVEFQNIAITDYHGFLSSIKYDKTPGYKIINKSEDLNEEFLNNFYFFPEQAEIEEIEKQFKKILGIDFIISEILLYFYQYTEKRNQQIKISKLQIKMNILSSIFRDFIAQEKMCASASVIDTIKKFDVTVISDSTSESILWYEIFYLIKTYYEQDLSSLKWNDESLPEEIPEYIKQLFKSFPNQPLTFKTLYIHMVAQGIVPFYISNSDLNVCKLLFQLEVFSVIREREPVDFPLTIKIFRTMDDLDEDTFDEISKYIHISFNKHIKIPLSSLNVETDVKKQISSDQFFQLKDTTVSIGDSSECFNEIYINRKLHQEFVEFDVELADSNYLFVICNVPSKIQKSFIKDFLVNKTENIFQKFCTNYSFMSLTTKEDVKIFNLWITTDPYTSSVLREINKTKRHQHFYVLQYEGVSEQNKMNLNLIYTNGSLEILKGYMHKEVIKDDDIAKQILHSKVNIISNIAGMGKSKLLQYILKTAPEDRWVVYIELNKYLHVLETIKNLDEFLDFLHDNGLIGTVTSTFQKTFKSFFKNHIRSGKLILLVDDFEEISRSLLDIFNEASNRGIRLLIVTRPSMKDEYENYFKTFSLKLVEFSEQDQYTFFKNFFTNKYPQKGLIIKRLDAIKKITANLESSFIGICQQTMMLAEIADSNPNIDQIIETHELYEKFISTTIDKYYPINKLFILKTISKLALTVFFKKAVLSQIFDWEEFECDIEVFKNEKSKTPFLEFTKIGDVVFSHKTYAEYLAARWLANYTKKQMLKDTSFNVKFILKNLYHRELMNTRQFFDNIILSMDTKRYVFDCYTTKVIFSLDILGRNYFHYRMTYGKQFDIHTQSKINEILHIKNNCLLFREKYFIFIKAPEILINSHTDLIDHKQFYDKLKIETIQRTNSSYINVRLKSLNQEERSIEPRDLSVKIPDIILDSSTSDLNRLLAFQRDDFLNLDPIKYALLGGYLYEIEILMKTKWTRLIDFFELDQDCCLLILYHSVKNGFNNILKMLVQRNFLKSQLHLVRDSATKMSLLHLAVKYRQEECIKVILDNNIPAKKFGKDINGNSPLHLLCDWKSVNVLKLFMSKKYDSFLRHKNKMGQNVLYCYTKNNNTECIRILIKYLCESDIDEPENESKNSPFILSILNKNLEIAKILHQKGANVNFTNKKGMTALHFCAIRGYERFAKRLLEWGANVNCTNEHGLTPLIFSARGGKIKILNLLLKCKADINYSDNKKWTALHHSVKTKNEEVVKILVQNQAIIDSANKLGNSPIILACISNFPTGIRILLNNIADSKQFSKNSRKKALHICQQRGHKDCEEIIQSYINREYKMDSIKPTKRISCTLKSQQKLSTTVRAKRKRRRKPFVLHLNGFP